MLDSHEDFTALSLNLPQHIAVGTQLTTEMLLHAFLAPDPMPHGTRLNDQVWCCDRCQGSSTPAKSFTFEALPSTLIVHFKRWTTTLVDGEYRAHILPTTIAPSLSFALNDATYTLVACVYYKGNTNLGHYVTVAKHDGTWWLYDDVIRKCFPAPQAEFHLHGRFMSYLCVYDKT